MPCVVERIDYQFRVLPTGRFDVPHGRFGPRCTSNTIVAALDPITKQPLGVKQAKVDKFWPLPYEFPTSCFFPSHRSLHYCPGSRHFDTFDSSRTIGPVHLLSLPLFPSQSSNFFPTTSVQIRPPACTGVKRTSLLSSIWIQGLPIYWPVITQAHQSHSM